MLSLLVVKLLLLDSELFSLYIYALLHYRDLLLGDLDTLLICRSTLFCLFYRILGFCDLLVYVDKLVLQIVHQVLEFLSGLRFCLRHSEICEHAETDSKHHKERCDPFSDAFSLHHALRYLLIEDPLPKAPMTTPNPRKANSTYCQRLEKGMSEVDTPVSQVIPDLLNMTPRLS